VLETNWILSGFTTEHLVTSKETCLFLQTMWHTQYVHVRLLLFFLMDARLKWRQRMNAWTDPSWVFILRRWLTVDQLPIDYGGLSTDGVEQRMSTFSRFRTEALICTCIAWSYIKRALWIIIQKKA
jgi:hypothetical protein